VREARRADDTLARGEWQADIKVADYQKALNLSVDTLTTKSKDLQVAAWTTEALAKLHGFVGLRDGLKILVGLQESFWDTLHPEIDEGDMESRANAIAWVDTNVGFAIKGLPFTGVAGYSLIDLEDSRVFSFPDDISGLEAKERERITALKAQAEKERRVTADLWRKEKTETRRASVEVVNYAIEECWVQLKELNRVIEEKFERNQAPGLSEFQKTLDLVHTQVKLLLEEKRAEEPDEVIFEESEDGAAEGGGGRASAGGNISGRQEALKRLAEIASFFKKTEPHSPVSYLVQKAVRWGEMPLDTWLQDVIKDQSVLGQLQETLGVVRDGDGTGG
jgi:type VI secretion system protein ImpA